MFSLFLLIGNYDLINFLTRVGGGLVRPNMCEHSWSQMATTIPWPISNSTFESKTNIDGRQERKILHKRKTNERDKHKIAKHITSRISVEHVDNSNPLITCIQHTHFCQLPVPELKKLYSVFEKFVAVK